MKDRALRFFIQLLLIAVSSAAFGSGVATAQAPRFGDYPTRVYSGSVRTPNLASHPEAGTYATRLRNVAKGQVNFAGEYVLGVWGCGAQCLMGAAINARTGRVIFLPGSICCWLDAGDNVNPIDYHTNSSLIVLKGLLNEREPVATHYYELRGGQFQLISAGRGCVRQPGSRSSGPPAGPGRCVGVLLRFARRPTRRRYLQNWQGFECGRQYATGGALPAIVRRQLYRRKLRAMPPGLWQV